MDVTELARSLAKKGPAPAYLVAGEEDALVDRAVAAITDRVLSGGQRGAGDFSLTRLDGKTCKAQDIEAAARTASLFGGRRLVIVSNAAAQRPEEQKKLSAYLGKPVPTTTLVLVVRGAGAGTRDPKRARAAKAAKLYKKAVEKGGGINVDCPRPRARDLPRLAGRLLEEQGLRADRDGQYALVEAVGEDLGGLVRAVEKLALYKGGSGTVGAEDVAEVVADTRSQSIFALTDAVGEGSADRALRILDRMLRDGESALAVLGHLARHLRNLARVQALDRRGQGQDTIRAELGLHPFVVKKCLMQVRRFSPGMLHRLLPALGEADVQLKRSTLPGVLVLERLVLDLCAGRGGVPGG